MFKVKPYLHGYFKGGGGGSSTQTVQTYDPTEAAQRAKVQSEAGKIYNSTAQKTADEPYPGAKPINQSQDTLLAQEAARAAGSEVSNNYLPQLTQATEYGLNGARDIMNNPYLDATIKAATRPITESYTDAGGVMSNIRAGAIDAGGQGKSTRQGIAEGIAAGRYADAIGDASAQIATDAYNKGQDTFTKTYALAPNAAAANMLPSQMYGAVGVQNEQFAQNQENYLGASRQYDLNADWLPLQNWANIVYGGTGPQGTTTTSDGGGSSGGPSAGGALGGAAAGFSVGGPWGAAAGAVLGGLFS